MFSSLKFMKIYVRPSNISKSCHNPKFCSKLVKGKWCGQKPVQDIICAKENEPLSKQKRKNCERQKEPFPKLQHGFSISDLGFLASFSKFS